MGGGWRSRRNLESFVVACRTGAAATHVENAGVGFGRYVENGPVPFSRILAWRCQFCDGSNPMSVSSQGRPIRTSLLCT
jgi:hypothetical protein